MSDPANRRDADARRTALDVTRSFIVQAPAGSGKTGLLIQRYLALLACVQDPERILAMTFTRKAAGEMRQRVLDALRAAQKTAEPASEHDALTWRLAREALRRDAALEWKLVAHPARLRVQTIDALCAALMRQAPLAAKLGALPRLIERAEALHVRAAREELAAASADDSSWQRLLEHLDNDANVAIALLAAMLGKRDQWLRHLVARDAAAMKATAQQALVVETQDELSRLRSMFPRHTIKGLLALAAHASGNLAAAEHARALTACGDSHDLPPATAEALPQWRALAEWLLTRKGEFREQFGIKQGFSPNRGGEIAKKQAMQALLAELAEVPGLAAALDQTRRLPSPHYEAATWEFAAALLNVLPRAAARLRTVFAREGVIDFAEATLVALNALGSAEAPSDLLLSLDLKVEHLLVDEFQDTSFAQYELIERLTSGWTPADGRTLFAVGDPMQSIYRFREAEVRLFIEAQQQARIGGVPVEALTLTQNFRSDPVLVEWVSRVFPGVLAALDDPARGAVAFRTSTAACDHSDGSSVTVDMVEDARIEARRVVHHVQSALDVGVESIAVLVRKRLDLEHILPALRAAQIAYEAVEIDRMADRQAILDLVSLTRALTQPDDRLGWFSVLRAPWCGLTVADLFVVARAGASFPELVSGATPLSGLSGDGEARLARLARVLRPVFAERGRVSLAAVVRGAWLALGGPACGCEPIDLAAADRFFDLLAVHARGADLPDWESFVDSLATLYAEPEPGAKARVQVMTLHRAKGLEFDVVVMPALSSGNRQADNELLLWRQRPAGLLLAPMRARAPGRTPDDVYEYLRQLTADEDQAELGRLLYVGCTRAKRRLHLTAVGEHDSRGVSTLRWKKPQNGTALHALWTTLMEDLSLPAPPAGTATPARSPSGGVPLARLPLGWQLPEPLPPLPAAVTELVDDREMIAFDWAREMARWIGTITHALLRQIAGEGLAAWDEPRVQALHARIEREFAAAGFTPTEARAATAQVLAAVRITLTDARGRWMFDPAHRDARSEYALTGVCDDALMRVVVDRSFVDTDDIRWIVDFKLSRHEGGNRELFLDREQERYRQQLESYARVMRGIDSRRIRLGLYFPLLAGWREWDAAL